MGIFGSTSSHGRSGRSLSDHWKSQNPRSGPSSHSASRRTETVYQYVEKCRSCKNKERNPDPNPNPSNYKILRCEQRNSHLVVEVLYPDATNYEGRKIIVYKNTEPLALMNTTVLDPHFFDDPKVLSPFARFEPTQEGWDAAIFLAENL